MSIRIATCDSETDPFKIGRVPEPFIWGLYFKENNKEVYKEFFETIDFVNYIKKCDLHVYAHNGGKFDYHFILQYADPGQKMLIINGRISRFKIGKATFFDSYNLLPVPLSHLAKDKFDYDKMESNVRGFHMDEIKKYLKSDCINLYHYLNEFVLNYGNKITVASSAFTFWKKQFNNIAPRSSVEYFERMREYYFGGRVQAFKKGIFQGDFKFYDIASAYPYVMKTFNHPISTRCYNTTLIKDSRLRNYFMEVNCFSRGAFPLRNKKGGIDFPHKKATYKITGHEFKTAKQLNLISDIKVINCIEFEEYMNFSDYVDYFFNLKSQAKKSGNDAHYKLSKLFLNSLYGKFGSNPQKYNDYFLGEYGQLPPIDEKTGIEYEPKEVIGDLRLFSKPLDEDKQHFYNVATSASITGAVRAYLMESIFRCEGVVYCDTDSILCENGDNLDLGNKLGQWELELSCHQIAIGGKKLYCLRGKDGSKDVVKTASKGVHLEPDEIERVCIGDVVKWQNPAPSFKIGGEHTFIERNICMR